METDTFDLVLAIPCAVSHKNKKNISKHIRADKLLMMSKRDLKISFVNFPCPTKRKKNIAAILTKNTSPSCQSHFHEEANGKR